MKRADQLVDELDVEKVEAARDALLTLLEQYGMTATEVATFMGSITCDVFSSLAEQTERIAPENFGHLRSGTAQLGQMLVLCSQAATAKEWKRIIASAMNETNRPLQ